MFSKFRSVLLSAAAAAIFATAVQAQATAPAKLAVINARKAVADTQDMRRALAALEAKYKPRQQALQSLQGQIQSIQQQLSTPNLPPDREAQLRADGTRKQKELQRLNEDMQSDVNNEQQDMLTRAGAQMNEVVKKIAQDRGLDVIIDISNTLFVKPALDLTAEATAAYDKAYPPK